MTESLRPTDWHHDPGREPGIAVPRPKDDPFYRYSGSLAGIGPGTVFKTRSFPYRAFGVPTWLKATQLLYRSTSQTGNPTVNVTSVIQPPDQGANPKVISYQSAYDSLNHEDEPSYAISGGVTLGGLVPNVELTVFGPFLAEGYTVIVPDTEGQRADFAAGPEYGMNTLDSIRAAFSPSSTVGLPDGARIAMLGYSGGAIATEWAAELAATYAPEVNARMIGAAMGGVLVDPAHNLHYVEGTWFWGGVLPMALVGIARAFEIDFTPYLTATGVAVFNEMQSASIVDVLGRYKGLTWQKLIIPAYPTPESLPLYVEAANKLIMGTGGTPSIPLFIGQGAFGVAEGTPGDKAGIGAGDGVMIAGDVRTLARNYCAKGTKVHYEQYDLLGHIASLVPWLTHSIAWIQQRFADLPAPQNCSSITPGNPLEPIPVP
ncbi:lipase family protein [Aldersonia sp. NBC_00410]|uniref:lipase family protein n=1 Tax=Aldersonia sp. NBC_00410 TaxID=2975954 RepID=UPI0022501B14|nr:lipase family protein [Aldersonia sp. NBC_00410]MCX5042421.1 lipase family protein [Aldersonia sp. NBC_00410]